MHPSDLIYDWNTRGDAFDYGSLRPVELDDETLRDGLQSPSVRDPSIGDKIRILHLMDALGIHSADIGLPGAGPRAAADVRALAKEIVASGLKVRPNCAARTVRADIEPIAAVSQEVGIAIEACTFIGSSPVRQYAEDWTLDRMLEVSEDAVAFAVAEGLPVMYVTEDTTRARPETLKALYGAAIAAGARRICVADTVGHATPHGVRQLIRFVRREVIEPSGEDVKLDFHGHRDRGLGVPNALAAIEEGVDRVHGTAMGIGERVGNAEMDLLLVNLKLLGLHDYDLSRLSEYCELVARATGVPLPVNYPVMGEDAFRTGTGVHAAAIIKARQKGDEWLADLVYSGVPAGQFGRRQVIEISHMSGMSNVKYWLGERGYDAGDDGLCQAVFDLAKACGHTLSEAEVRECCERYLEGLGTVREREAGQDGPPASPDSHDTSVAAGSG
ncbi:MAG TPA: LeuA family protein [Longimicrobiales bacterium]|nr:LeuA family protein [Longimicrobiales bacterium]